MTEKTYGFDTLQIHERVPGRELLNTYHVIREPIVSHVPIVVVVEGF